MTHEGSGTNSQRSCNEQAGSSPARWPRSGETWESSPTCASSHFREDRKAPVLAGYPGHIREGSGSGEALVTSGS